MSTTIQAQAPRRRTKMPATGVYRSVSGCYEIQYRDSDGRVRFETVSDDYDEAKARRAEVIVAMKSGEKRRRTDTRFAEYAAQVIDSADGSSRTIEKHHYHLAKHLIPVFGRRRLNEIDVDRVAAFVKDMKRAGYSGSTIGGALSTLSLVMSRAKRRGYAPSNPTLELDDHERPKRTRPEKRVLSDEEVARLLSVAGDTFGPLIATLVSTGLRLGEALGLTWAEIDFDNGYLRVREQLGRDHRRSPLKSAATRRDVILTPELQAILRRHRMRSPYKRPSDFVFCAPDGRPRDHRSTGRGIERAAKRAGLGDGVSAHNLRHTNASHLIVGMREDPVSVAHHLGHTKASFTMDFYAREYDKVRHDEERRKRYSDGFGHLLNRVNTMSTGA